MNTLTKIIKDICTLANGEDYCIVGIAGMVGLFIIIGVIAFASYYFLRPIELPDKTVKITDLSEYGAFIEKMLQDLCALVLATGGGKMMTNKAEPNT